MDPGNLKIFSISLIVNEKKMKKNDRFAKIFSICGIVDCFVRSSISEVGMTDH